MEDCKVSVLMAVYNGETYLDKAIISILQQSYEDFEFLIIDDASTDKTIEILRSYSDPRITVVRNETNFGLTKSLNIGLKLAKGKYIARQDCDDISYKLRLERQVQFLDLNPEVILVGAQSRIIDSDGKPLRSGAEEKETSKLSVIWQLMFDSPFIHSTVMFRKDIVHEKYGGYDEQFRTSQDFVLWSKLSKENTLLNLNEILLDFRTHEKSVSSNYSVENLNRTAPIYIDNIVDVTGDRHSAADFVNVWLGAKRSSQFSIPAQKKKLLTSMIDNIYEKFVAKYPEAVHDKAVNKSVARKYRFCALYCISCSRLESIIAFYKAVSFDKNILAKEMPQYLIRVLIGASGVSVLKNIRKIASFNN